MKRFLDRAASRALAPLRRDVHHEAHRAHLETTRLRVAVGALTARQVAATATDVTDAEFRAFSQFGEDGIIEYLIRNCDVAPESFVEIGVEDYGEANTRFLVEHRHWRGVIVDCNPDLVADLEATQLSWRSQVRAASAFVTRENVREIVDPLVSDDGLGLLSVDIDGVDYWVLEALLDLRPAMVVTEYNALFGPSAAVSVPYTADFDRSAPQFHNVYYGAGLAAFAHLLGDHGYSLVTCNRAGNNAFFVQTDRLRDVPARTLEAAYRPRRFTEHRTTTGALSGIVSPRRQLEDVRRLPLVDVRDGRSLHVDDLLHDGSVGPD